MADNVFPLPFRTLTNADLINTLNESNTHTLSLNYIDELRYSNSYTNSKHPVDDSLSNNVFP